MGDAHAKGRREHAGRDDDQRAEHADVAERSRRQPGRVPAGPGEAERARDLVGMSAEQMAAFLGVSSRTYERRAKSGVLSEAESVKVEFLIETLRLAEEVFHSPEDGSAWMRSPLVAFGRRTPIEMLHSVRGYEQVKDALNQIRYGMF
jgi:putative toxin-antitoxin system antitoxin component (TIGR02293 family)